MICLIENDQSWMSCFYVIEFDFIKIAPPKKWKKFKFCLKSIIAWISSYTMCFAMVSSWVLELSILEILWLWFEGTWIISNLFCCSRFARNFVIWKRKLLWNLLWFGVKILLVWRAWDLSCWLEVHLHVSLLWFREMKVALNFVIIWS